MRRFRALIFDVDGTMAETEELHRRAFNESFEHFGLNWYWDVVLYRSLLAVTGGKERIAHFQERCSGMATKLATARIAELRRFKTARYADLLAGGGCPLRQGVAEIIAGAQKRAQFLAIATTTSRDNVDALLALTLGASWKCLFQVVVTGEDVARKKPAPDAYLKVIEALALAPTACLAFEDSRNGLLAAKAAGIPVVITRSMYFERDQFDGALQVVKELSELRIQD